MPRRIRAFCLIVALGGAIALAQPSPQPPAGNWKILLPVAGEDSQASWIVRFEKKADVWTGYILATADGMQPAKIEGLTVTADAVAFSLKMANFALPVELKMPTEKQPALLGTATIRGKASPIRLEPTLATALDDFARSLERLARPENDRETYRAALTLIALGNERKAKPEDLKSWAERAALSAESFGAETRDSLLNLANFLVEIEGGPALATLYATKAEGLIAPTDPPVVLKRILRTQMLALERAGKDAEAKAMRQREEKIALIRLQPYSGKPSGFVLIEGFLCAQQGSCVAAALTEDALARTYADHDVYVLNHHLCVPGPDPLTNPSTEERARYYRPRETPTVYFNGKASPGVAGSLDDAQAKYDGSLGAVNGLLEKATVRPGLSLTALRKGETIEVEANVRDLPASGEEIRLRLALVEDVVVYTGANGLPRQMSVVRDYFGTAAGLALLDRTITRSANIDVGDLRKRLRAYLEKANEATPFPSKVWPLEMKKLRIVGFVQNDRTREVLTVTGADIRVPGEPLP